MITLQELLKDLNACKEAHDWVGDKTIEQAVAECPRGDWMLWLAGRVGVNRQSLILAAGHCANTVRHLMTDERSTNAVDAAIAFGEGRASEEDLQAARAAARAAAMAAAEDALAAEAAAMAAAEAAWAAAEAAEAAWASWEENQKQTADICRKYIGKEIIEKVNHLQ